LDAIDAKIIVLRARRSRRRRIVTGGRMGREASCECKWANETGPCRVLLESTELVVRGAIRRRIPISSLADVSVKGEHLVFRTGQDVVTLRLGQGVAGRWARAITASPPSLAKKLGISGASYILLIGRVDDDALVTAMKEAHSVDGKEANLILACVHTQAELDRALTECARFGAVIPPVWIVYPKGANRRPNESVIREAFRSKGFIDTKVASVSAGSTALRFVKRSVKPVRS
jgi:hypothetical protein